MRNGGRADTRNKIKYKTTLRRYLLIENNMYTTTKNNDEAERFWNTRTGMHGLKRNEEKYMLFQQ